jgi:hypothetical protein
VTHQDEEEIQITLIASFVIMKIAKKFSRTKKELDDSIDEYMAERMDEFMVEKIADETFQDHHHML